MNHFRHAAILIILIFLPVLIFARNIEIFVEDEDLLLPLEGAMVSLRGGTQFVCDEKGIARVTLPDGRQTVISVSYPGYETFRLTIPAEGSDTPTKFTVSMRLGDIIMSQELVLEAPRPETSETRSGRSVAISDRELTRTAEIGIIEDVMHSVKLLPGVGYAGMFSAMPSIRGGDPGDLVASFDGFYLENPYHWMGGISIFDPKMISGAQLSHGVFSARYGHTISGLLEVTSKTPSSTETELETAIGSSAATLNLSIPLNNRGGILFMGKLTYWDTLVWAAQQLSKTNDNEYLDMINYVTTAPYIRSAALSMNYRLTPETDFRLNFFFGSDGVGADFETDYSEFINDDIEGAMTLEADYANYQGFLISGITMSPVPVLALKFTGGVGFNRTATEDLINNNITAAYKENFLAAYPGTYSVLNQFLDPSGSYSAPNINAGVDMESTIFNAQIRADADIDLSHGFIAAVGVHELYSLWAQRADITLSFLEIPATSLHPAYISQLFPAITNSDILELIAIPGLEFIIPRTYNTDMINHGLTTSAYTLLEFTTPDQRFGTELGLRLDHLYFTGKNFDISTKPALNPRLNIDLVIIKNMGDIDSLTATAGSGLFSSINSLISFYDPDQFGIGGDVTFNRSWTSVVGFKLDFLEKYSFIIEGYYKYVYDRAYITADIISSGAIIPTFQFDGIGHVWGFDFQLQKLESRYWDGWLTYTFTWAKYNNPLGGSEGVDMGSTYASEEWFFPSFHRFHNFNLVLNIKPLTWFNIGIRFGFASGQPRDKVSDEIEPYPVLASDENGNITLIQKYRRKQLAPEDQGIERSAWAFPLDIKLNFFLTNKRGRAAAEIYIAGENLLSFIYSYTGRTTFNEYTGNEDRGSGTSSFDLPIPMLSFGFKWRY
ncbi:MAG: hypothetical protein FWC03_08115 [Treponema sp.]|nr:hypothetical protein [Treponema sp.]